MFTFFNRTNISTNNMSHESYFITMFILFNKMYVLKEAVDHHSGTASIEIIILLI